MPDAVENLLDRAFGTDRQGRTAYRLRPLARPIAPLSFAAFDSASTLVGSLQSWPIGLESGDGTRAPLVLVGPVAVAPGLQGRGVGVAMMRALLAAADSGAIPAADAMTMIGDPEYYGRFGFTADATAGWRLPGPWEPRRLLARITRPAGLPDTGSLAPA